MSPFLGFTKKSSTLPRVVWPEESKNGLGFETGPSYDDVPTKSQLLNDTQFSCRAQDGVSRSQNCSLNTIAA